MASLVRPVSGVSGVTVAQDPAVRPGFAVAPPDPPADGGGPIRSPAELVRRGYPEHMTGADGDGSAIEWLRTIPLFEGMSDEELGRLRRLGTRVEVAAGEILVDQGDPGTYCFAIADGTAGVFVSGEHVATVGPGSTIGEMALIDHRPRTATVVANDPMVLLRFDTRSFREMLEDMPKASERIHGILASRLRD